MTLGIMQSNFSSILMRKQRPRKVTKLGTGSQEDNSNLLIPERQDSFLLSPGETHTHSEANYTGKNTTMQLLRKGLVELIESREAGKHPSLPTKQHTERKQEATGGGLRMNTTAHFTKSTNS